MKKTRKFRLFTVLIALCMLVGTIPAYAVNPYGSLTLTFTSEEDIDLGGIEISVYQAAPATVTETYTLYNETFHSTVTTDQNGSVTFAKPSQYCSITVELDSLPDGVGITKQTKFFNPDVTEQTIILATVDRAETELSGTEVKPTFYSADNMQLLADYEVVMSDNAYATMPWESIDAMDSFTLSGAFVDGDMAVPYSISVDISEANVVEKYTTLYDYGMISEREKIIGQCEVLKDPQNTYMRSSETMDAIKKYRDKVSVQSDFINSGDIIAYATPTKNADLALIEDILTFDIASLVTARDGVEILQGNYAVIYSDLSGSAIEAFAAELAAEMNTVHVYFNSYLGFTMPNDSSGVTGKIGIEIVDDTYEYAPGYTMANIFGITYPDGYICINYDMKDHGIADHWKTTLAHEYQHAIQYTYVTNNGNGWLADSCANFASAMYALNILGEYDDRVFEYKDSINNYLSSPSQSLTSAQYSMLFPIYLYSNTGSSGWNTIKKMYEYIYPSNPISTEITFSALDQALKSIDSSYSANTFFENFAVDNLFLESTYPVFYDADWSELSRNQYIAYQYKTDLGNSISPLGAKYHEISGFEDDTGVYITFDLTSGSYSDFSVLGVIHNGENPMESLHVNAPNPERFTITLSNNTIEYYLGNSSGYTYYTLVAVNTGYTTPITYDITVN